MDVLDAVTLIYFLGVAVGVAGAAVALVLAMQLATPATPGGRERWPVLAGLLLGLAVAAMLAAWIGLQLDLAHDTRDLFG